MKICSHCHSVNVKSENIIHHMLCAYVGPISDFEEKNGGYVCPKCYRALNENDRDSEIVGICYTCLVCGYEESDGVK
jgi:hypothetical protein